MSNIFGNFYISRINNNSNNNSNKTCNFNNLCEFYVGSTVSTIEKSKLSPLGKQVIIYGTITGTIGIFIPFLSSKNAQFNDALQYYLPNKFKSLSGQQHILYRSKYTPSKNCTDSDYCLNFKNIKHIDKLWYVF